MKPTKNLRFYTIKVLYKVIVGSSASDMFFVFWAVSCAFYFKVGKKWRAKIFFVPKYQCGVPIKAKFAYDLEPLEEVSKMQAKRVINENVMNKKKVFDFYGCVQKFSAWNFFRWKFLHFLQRIRYQHKIQHFMTSKLIFCYKIVLLHKHFVDSWSTLSLILPISGPSCLYI